MGHVSTILTHQSDRVGVIHIFTLERSYNTTFFSSNKGIFCNVTLFWDTLMMYEIFYQSLIHGEIRFFQLDISSLSAESVHPSYVVQPKTMQVGPVILPLII